MGRYLSLQDSVSMRFQFPGRCTRHGTIQSFDIPSRTFTWTLEYPLVTFLTPRIIFDILAAGLGDQIGRWERVAAVVRSEVEAV